MAIRTYDTNETVWKDIADLQTPEINGVRHQPPCANACVDGVWKEVWAAAPDGYIIYNGRDVTGLDLWTIGVSDTGSITLNNAVNVELTSADYNSAEYNYQRINGIAKLGLVSIPSGVSKLYVDYEIYTNIATQYLNVTPSCLWNTGAGRTMTGGTFANTTGRKTAYIDVTGFTSLNFRANVKAYPTENKKLIVGAKIYNMWFE